MTDIEKKLVETRKYTASRITEVFDENEYAGQQATLKNISVYYSALYALTEELETRPQLPLYPLFMDIFMFLSMLILFHWPMNGL